NERATAGIQATIVSPSEGSISAILSEVPLCNHFLTEPSIAVENRFFSPEIIRVGTTVIEGHLFRARSIGRTSFKKRTVLWGVDQDENGVYIAARVQDATSWSDVVVARKLNQLV